MILYGITIVTSAFLLFLVQPIIAKQILPWFGGSAAVWTTCVVFFQAVLLAGYAYAHGLTRRAPRTQAFTHIALLALSIAALPIIASSAWKPTPETDPTWRILGLLVATIGLPYFLLSSTGPLIQKWFAEDRDHAAHAASVYRLFALSNAGSLVGLLIYPFVVEPYAPLAAQSWGWSAGYGLFALACGACAWRARRTHALMKFDDEVAPHGVDSSAVDSSAVVSDAIVSDAIVSNAAPGIGRYMFWLGCAALGSLLLLALTNHITQNIASIPFLWVLPLSLYLLSFVVVFEGRAGRGWYARRWWLGPVLAAVVAMAWALTTHRGVLGIYAAIPIYSVGLFFACVFCHGELAASKPAPAYLTQFYLCLSAGGAVGGLFVALVAPKLFNNYWETPLALVGVCALGLFAVRERRATAWAIGSLLGVIAAVLIFVAAGDSPLESMAASVREAMPGHASSAFVVVLVIAVALIFIVATWRKWPLAIAIAALACTGFYSWKYYRFLSEDTRHASRNFYGTLRVKQSEAGPLQQRRLLHGVILHGDQYTAPDKRRMPTTYYGPGSGIALALRELRAEHAPLDVAMIGLGTGTLTAWGKAGDRYRIYELNPAVFAVARRDFTYLADSQAAITPVLGDARLSMERELADGSAVLFDVIAVDAFSSDSIPVHLITREALAVYLRHLKPDGVIAFHVSNRFLKLAPVVAQLADDADLDAVNVIDDPSEAAYSNSEWVLVTRNQEFLDRDVVLAASSEIDAIPGLPIWTDQFNNLFKILK